MRKPVAQGFYPFDRSELLEMLKILFSSAKSVERPSLGAIVPHAGYVFSGEVAAEVYASIKSIDSPIVLLGPNHTGIGSRFAVSFDDWETPLGVVKNFRPESLKRYVDESAHRYEHSLEVQLPFLQYRFENFKIIPITISLLSLDEIESIAEELSRIDGYFIASSDFIHYGPMYGFDPYPGIDKVSWVRERDNELAKMIENLQYRKFYRTVAKNGYTVCGFVPITLMLAILKKRGASRGFLLSHKSSFDISPSDSFVDYVGMVFD